jgi:hypothetical protein
MDVLTKDDLRNLIERRDSLCASIYMPTHRTMPETRQDPIRFKNLLRQMEERLVAEGHRKSEVRDLSKQARDLTKDYLFWQYQNEGFAAFISSEWFRHYRLPASFEELTVVADRFHIKPLLQLFSDDYGFYVLALSQNERRLFHCSPYNISEIQLENVPASLGAAVQYDERRRQIQFHTKTPGGRGDRTAIFHGHGMGKDDTKGDILNFFRQVDQGLQKVLGGESSPLVLAGVDYLLPIYRDASSYPQIMQEGISGNPENLRPEELHRAAWNVVEPHFLKARKEAIARYAESAGSSLASSDIRTIASAAYQGRIDLLFVALGIQRWGALDADVVSVHLHEGRKAGDEDLLDFAAVHTLLNGGTVYALKPEDVPGKDCSAALFRY